MNLPEHVIVIIVNTFFIIPIIIIILSHFRKKNVEWRDELKSEIKEITTSISVIQKSIQNNIRSNLFSVLDNECEKLNFNAESRHELSLKFYIESRIPDFGFVYTELKTYGNDAIYRPSCISHLSGKSTAEILHRNTDFSKEFSKCIEMINTTISDKFTRDLFLRTNYSSDDRLEVIKDLILKTYGNNIRQIIKLFLKSVYNKNHSDFIDSLLRTDENIKIQASEKNFLKDLISSGDSGIERCLKALKEIINDAEKINELVIQSARFNRYQLSERMNSGIDETELNNIRSGLLNLIDKL